MSENNLLEMIKSAQMERGQPMLSLIKKFSPLIYKYAGMLRYEDAKYDLQYDFIKLIADIDIQRLSSLNKACILSYIQTSIYHCYIAHSICKNKLDSCSVLSSLSEAEQFLLESLTGKSDEYEGLIIHEMRERLNDHEFKIIYQHFFLGLSIEEISSKNGVSRQSTNQSKKRALEKIQKTLLT